MYFRIAILVACCTAIPFQATYAEKMSDVVTAAQTELPGTASEAVLPPAYAFADYNPDLQNACQYAAPFHFTVSALRTWTFRELFGADTSAVIVVSDWFAKTDSYERFSMPVFEILRKSLEDVKNELNKDEYESLKFHEMVDFRINRNFPSSKHPLDDKINNLVKAGFRFPLFDVGSRLSVNDRLKLLNKFVQIHTEPSTGGLGNLTWEQIYHVQAMPFNVETKKGFKKEFIDDFVSAMHNQIIPIPLVDCREMNIHTLFAGNNHCCCNNSAHGSLKFRRCTGFGELNCIPANGSSFCSVGSQFCPSDHDPH